MTLKSNLFLLPQDLGPEWISKNYPILKNHLKKSDLKLDCAKLNTLNSLGLSLLADLHHTAGRLDHKLILVDIPANLRPVLSKARDNKTAITGDIHKGDPVFYKLGDSAENFLGGVLQALHLFTEALYWSTLGFFKPKTIPRGATTAQMIYLGSSALPIVLLLSFLIGLTLAIQSAVQLEQFGASIYLASGIGISMVTEIGPLITAIIMAGRSGSSITAEISTMVVQDELRALKTMAVNPIHFLFLPRFWAMTLTLPLLTISADLIGIFAGLIISFFWLNIPPVLFFNELLGAVSLNMVLQSMEKAVCFAWIITLVAVFKGFNARGGADAVGKATTSCVVTSIFCIIMADAIFSFIFYF